MFIVVITHRSFIIRTHTHTTMASESIVAPESVSVAVASDSEYWPRTASAANAWDFSYMNDSLSTSNLRDGLLAVVRAAESPAVKTKEIDVWKYLSNYSPPSDRGFMFSGGDDWIITLVQNEMEVGHSGCSMGWTMRNIEFIAKNGLPAHRDMYLNRSR
jgi:hypothetical protein